MSVGRSSGTDEPSGYFGNQAVFGPLLLSTTQLGRSCKSGNELEKVCRSAGRTFKPFLYGAMHDGNDYKNRSIRLQQFSPKTACWSTLALCCWHWRRTSAGAVQPPGPEPLTAATKTKFLSTNGSETDTSHWLSQLSLPVKYRRLWWT